MKCRYCGATAGVLVEWRTSLGIKDRYATCNKHAPRHRATPNMVRLPAGSWTEFFQWAAARMT